MTENEVYIANKKFLKHFLAITVYGPPCTLKKQCF